MIVSGTALRVADFIYKTNVDILGLNGIETVYGMWFEVLTTTTSLLDMDDEPDEKTYDNEKYAGYYVLDGNYTEALSIDEFIYLHLNGKTTSGAITLDGASVTVFDDSTGKITGTITMKVTELLQLGGEISSAVTATENNILAIFGGTFSGSFSGTGSLMVGFDAQLGTSTAPFAHNSVNPIYYASTTYPLESGAKFYIDLSNAKSGDVLAIDMEQSLPTTETFTSYCTLSNGAFVTSYDSGTGYITLTGVDVDSTNNIIYANGLALVVTDGTTDDYSAVFWDADGDGSYDADDGDIYVKENADLSTWTIYGGSKDANVTSSNITIAGGSVSAIYTGGHDADSSGDDGVVTMATLTISGDATKMTINTTATDTNLTVLGGGEITIDVGNIYKLVSNAGTINWDGGTIGTLAVSEGSTTSLDFAPLATNVQLLDVTTLATATKFITLAEDGGCTATTFTLVDGSGDTINSILVLSGDDLYFAPELSASIVWTGTAQYDSKTTATVTLSNMDLGDSAVFVKTASIYAVGTSGDVKVGEITIVNGTTVYETVAIDLTDGNISVDSSLNVKLYVVLTLESGISTTAASYTLTSQTLALSKNIASFTVTNTSHVFDGTDKAVTITGTGSSLEASDFTITYYLITAGNPSPTATTPVDAGTYLYVIGVAATSNFDDTYYDVGTSNTGTLTITTADSTVTPDVEDESTYTYTYGESIVLTADVGIAAASIAATTPDADKVTFTATGTSGEIPLGTAEVSYKADGTGTATLTYKTTDKTIAVGTYTIKAYYGGGDSLNLNESGENTITITLKAKTIDDVSVDTTDTSYDFSKDYTGAVQDFEDIPLSSTDVETGDTVSLTVDYSTTAADADDYAVSGTVVLGSNDDGAYYVLAETIAFTGIVTIDAVAPIFDSITASRGNSTVTIEWEVDDGSSDLTGYTLSATYLVEDVVTDVDGAPFTDIALDATSYTVSGLTNGTEYTFVLTATNAEGDTNSADLTATPYKSSSSGGSSVTYYTSTLEETVNGEASLSDTSAIVGKTITITTNPDEGYAVASVTVTKSGGDAVSVTDNGDGTYSYLQPASDATVTVSFVAVDEEESVFTDLDEDDWYFDAVEWAVDNGITNGTSSTSFSPDMICTRAQAVTFIWKSYGSPECSGENPFVDVAEDSYYYEAVLWAVSEGITIGTSDTTFSPDVDCTRGHIVTFLHRAAGEPLTDSENLFTDVGENAYYYSAVLWAISEEITNGTSDDAFSPNKDCTRSEIVTFLYRYFAI